MAASQVDTRKEHKSIEKERRNIELVLEKFKAADSVQDGTEEKK